MQMCHCQTVSIEDIISMVLIKCFLQLDDCRFTRHRQLLSLNWLEAEKMLKEDCLSLLRLLQNCQEDVWSVQEQVTRCSFLFSVQVQSELGSQLGLEQECHLLSPHLCRSCTCAQSILLCRGHNHLLSCCIHLYSFYYNCYCSLCRKFHFRTLDHKVQFSCIQVDTLYCIYQTFCHTSEHQNICHMYCCNRVPILLHYILFHKTSLSIRLYSLYMYHLRYCRCLINNSYYNVEGKIPHMFRFGIYSGTGTMLCNLANTRLMHMPRQHCHMA